MILDTSQSGISSMARNVERIVGTEAIADSCGVSQAKFIGWIDSTGLPSDEEEINRLVNAYWALETVSSHSSPETAEQWFHRPSCGSDKSMSPSQAIQVCNFEDLKLAVDSFVGSSWD